jgi:glycosyltransferase involved in cell wall biosynthesis
VLGIAYSPADVDVALRKPVVQYDVVEGRHSAGEASLYARRGDEADFPAKIVELLDAPEARERMGAVGRERMETSLEWRLQIPSLLAAYDRALEKTERRRSRRRRTFRR